MNCPIAVMASLAGTIPARVGAAILLRMLATSPPTRATATPGWRRIVTILTVNIVLWTLLSALGALTSLNDDLRHGVQGSYWLILRSWGGSSLVLAVEGMLLYLVFSRWPQIVASARNIALGYGALLLLLLPLQMIFLLKLYLPEAGPGLSWAGVEQQITALDRFASLLEFSANSGVYFAVVALKVWQHKQLRERAFAQAQADSLALRLELEQQRSLALRAQLEPHFMFNALNAISALVRSDDKEVALDGIHALSELLRYALAASAKSWVRLAEELDFVDQYLALQRLRHGARLQVHMEGLSEAVLACDCPPLLLQPLVENALRHDLDCHRLASDIRLDFTLEGQQLQIRISNPVHAEAASNPGVGLGLRNTQARLQLVYGAAAQMHTAVVDGRFDLQLEFPAHART